MCYFVSGVDQLPTLVARSYVHFPNNTVGSSNCYGLVTRKEGDEIRIFTVELITAVNYVAPQCGSPPQPEQNKCNGNSNGRAYQAKDRPAGKHPHIDYL
jgi:hypothetical protein